ncbi:MAG: HAD hydrolase family protein [Clostridia bacterium]|nr:HAD hydrolase family protein [Clostridia bacterium]
MLKRFPPIGQRIIKSAAAVALCMIIYYIRSLLPIGEGIPFYSALAALWCMQPYIDTTKNNAGQRLFGTLTGAVYGLVFLNILNIMGITEPIFVYLLASLLIIPVIYSTVLLKKRNASFFSCVVFLSIALTHSFDQNPYFFVFDRILDTLIGIGVGIGINEIHFPIKHDYETLYISGIDDVLVSSDKHSVPYSKVELNRLIKSGVKFSISTVRTSAELISIMNGVELNQPVIVMDGAALYDIQENRYLETFPLPDDICLAAEKTIAESGLNCFVSALCDSTLLTYYGELKNKAEKDLIEKQHRTLHINFISSSFRHKGEKVLCLAVIAQEKDIIELKNKLNAYLGGSIRITTDSCGYEGYLCLKVFSARASKQEMMKKLQEHTGAEKVVTFGSIKGEYDVYIHDGGGNATIKKLKKLYRNGSLH